ncbi:MAG TPA: hypothetical protein VNT56_09315 [Acidimicrobiales bacterium]|jgi:hypothetical protein|nr:hypothetical protein [Acidimicrobiales bacterium]
MGAATIVTLIGVFLVVAALAGYLITIAATLRDVSFTLGTIIIGVRAIANQVAPVRGVVNDILADVVAMDTAFKSLLARGGQVGAGSRGALTTGGARTSRLRGR